MVFSLSVAPIPVYSFRTREARIFTRTAFNMPSATTFKGSKSGKIRKSNKEFDAPKADKVLVRVSHSGLCGTDEHYKTTDMVLGHEGIGIVEKVGSEVTSLRE